MYFGKFLYEMLVNHPSLSSDVAFYTYVDFVMIQLQSQQQLGYNVTWK